MRRTFLYVLLFIHRVFRERDQEGTAAAVLGVGGISAMCQLTGAKGTSGAMESTEVALVGFGGSWVKLALPLGVLGSSGKMGVSSHTWHSGCWSMFLTPI